MSKATSEEARSMIAGAFADFIIFLDLLPNPIIVGGGYKRERLIAAFHDWATTRGFSVDKANLQSWRFACQQGYMRG